MERQSFGPSFQIPRVHDAREKHKMSGNCWNNLAVSSNPKQASQLSGNTFQKLQK
jgi:hypothetical protein